jgi:hypothetical protein
VATSSNLVKITSWTIWVTKGTKSAKVAQTSRLGPF